MIYYTIKTKVEQYKLLKPMLEALSKEMDLLSKKKPNDPLNEYKVKTINRVLEPKKLLDEEDTFIFLDILDSENLPTNSDVVLTLSQFNSAIETFYYNYYNRSTTI